jgi:hypothetical protein
LPASRAGWPSITHRLNRDETAIKKIWDSAEFKEFINRRGFDMIYLDSADFAEFIRRTTRTTARR